MPLNTDDSRGVVAISAHYLGMDAMTEVRLYIATSYSYLRRRLLRDMGACVV